MEETNMFVLKKNDIDRAVLLVYVIQKRMRELDFQPADEYNFSKISVFSEHLVEEKGYNYEIVSHFIDLVGNLNVKSCLEYLDIVYDLINSIPVNENYTIVKKLFKAVAILVKDGLDN